MTFVNSGIMLKSTKQPQIKAVARGNITVTQLNAVADLKRLDINNAIQIITKENKQEFNM